MRTSIGTSLLATALALGLSMAAPGADARDRKGDATMTGQQVRELLTSEGYTKIDDPEFEDGMWETDATSADGNRVDVRVDPASGKVYAEDIVSRLSAEDIKARVTAAGYSKVHDVDYDDGVWKADAERQDGKNVELKIDPNDGRILAVEND
ncbi:PepSY domain-containing protein [Xanthomonas sp. XNM01]|uniref:PepSY domain-containing protein n=1 Tax=Xanthomonas sp. XNM01 TaxID=2769289 RepID=UPI0017850EA8|nr:PepSY domain-containing protein [Xanthomonas sp. XNM01]MBD9370780.1 PepSY domain-containing protein [Xanthomonas sp. XNM01]